MASNQTPDSGNPESIPYSNDVPEGESASAFAADSSEAPVQKSKYGNLILIGAALIFVGGVGFIGYNMLTKMNSKPVPRPAASAPLQPAVEKPVEAAPAAHEDPIGGSGLAPTPVDPAEAGLDPMTGLPSSPQGNEHLSSGAPVQPQGVAIDPMTGLPSAQPSVAPPAQPSAIEPQGSQQVPAVAAPQGVTPASAQPGVVPPPPTGQLPIVATQPVASGQQQPAVSQPVATTTAPAAPVQQPANYQGQSAVPVSSTVPASTGGADQLRTDILGALDRFQETVASMDTRITTRVDGLATQVQGVEARLTALENGRPTAVARTAAPKTAARAPVRHKPAQQARPVARPAARPANRVEILSRGDQPAAPVVSAPQSVSENTSCSVASIQPGRFWVRRSDGSFSTYGEGDRIDGGRVTKIDPQGGIQVDGRRWNCGG